MFLCYRKWTCRKRFFFSLDQIDLQNTKISTSYMFWSIPNYKAHRIDCKLLIMHRRWCCACFASNLFENNQENCYIISTLIVNIWEITKKYLLAVSWVLLNYHYCNTFNTHMYICECMVNTNQQTKQFIIYSQCHN